MFSVKTMSLLGVSLICAAIAFGRMGGDGLIGVAAGIGIALLVCGVSSSLTRRAQQRPSETVKLVLLSVLSSFVLLILGMVVVAALAKQYLTASTLTSLTLYLVFRAYDVADVSRSLSMQTTVASTSAPSVSVKSTATSSTAQTTAQRRAGSQAEGEV